MQVPQLDVDAHCVEEQQSLGSLQLTGSNTSSSNMEVKAREQLPDAVSVAAHKRDSIWSIAIYSLRLIMSQ